MKVKEESEKPGLKLNVQKMKILASGPITSQQMGENGKWKSWLKAQHSENEDHGNGPISSWQIDGETVETASGFILGGSKISADSDCSHKI